MCAIPLTQNQHKETKEARHREKTTCRNLVMLIATLLKPGSIFRERNCERSLQQPTLTEERSTDHTTGRCRKRCDTSYQNSERSKLTGHPQRLARPSPGLFRQARSSRPLRSYDRKETRSENFSLSTANSPDRAGARLL